MPAVRIKDHWREQRLFEQRAIVCAAFMGLATIGLIARLYLLQVAAPRLLRRALAGQPRPHRADPGRARPDPRPPRRAHRRQPARLPARAGARGGRRPRRHTRPAGRARPDRPGGRRTSSSAPSTRAAASTACRCGCACRTRTSRASPCTASSSRASTSRRARRASTRTASWRCTRSATSARSASSDLKHIDRAAYSGTSLIGKLGVESAYEKQLHGTNGFREMLVNALGRSVQRQGPFAAGPAHARRRPPARTWCCRSTSRSSAWPRTRSASTAALWWRSIRATATCSRSPAARASTRRCSRAASRARVRRAARTTSTSRCSTARCAAPIRPARPSSR